MKKALILAALILPSVSALAQSPGQWSGSLYFDLRTKETSMIVLSKITTFDGFLGRPGLSVDLKAFAGMTTRSKTPVAGFALTKSYQLTRDGKLFIEGGFGWTAVGGQVSGVGIELGLSARF